MSTSFSFTDTPKKRKMFATILAAMFTTMNVALYFQSSNEFPEHIGLTNHRLSEFNKDNTGQLILFSFICFFCALLGYSNQKSYSYHINKTLPKPNDQRRSLLISTKLLETEEDRPPNPTRFDLTQAAISSAFKAVVASTSLAALLKNTAGSFWAIAVSVLCAPGNFVAQFAIFAAPLLKTYNIPLGYKTRWFFAHLLTWFYNVPNTALYFNAGDVFLRLINVLKNRLIEGQTAWEYGLLSFLVISSAFLLFSTQRSYSKKIANIFTDPNKENTIDISHFENNSWRNVWDKLTPFFQFDSCYTAVYKAIINYISLVATLFSFTKHLGISFTLSSICLIGNLYAQFSILKPERSRQQIIDDHLEPKKSIPCCFGLFNKVVRQEMWERFYLQSPNISNT